MNAPQKTPGSEQINDQKTEVLFLKRKQLYMGLKIADDFNSTLQH